jgi:PAS domain S-box-containing protein
MHSHSKYTWAKAVKSIEYTRRASAKKEDAPLNFYKNNNGRTKSFFEPLGISSREFKFLFDRLPVGVALNKIIYNRRGVPVNFVTLDVNPTYLKVLGVTRGQLLNKASAMFYPKIKDHPIDWVAAYGRVASTGKSETFEVLFPVTNRYYNVTVHSPKKGYCFSAFMDITDYKTRVKSKLEAQNKIELSLKASLEKYQYLLKSVPVAICELDFETLRFKSVNDAMTQILGYSEQELLNLSPFDLLYPESKQRFEAQMKKGIDGKKAAESMEYHCRTKDGRGIWCVINVKINFVDDKPIDILIVAHDITARKKAEQELVLAEKRFRRLYMTTQDGIMARDIHGKMIDCNPAYAKMLGYTRKELKNLSVQQLLPEKWHSQRNRIVRQVLQTGRSIVFEREYKRKDGSIFPASVRTWRLTDGKGKAIGIWSIVRDISEQKQQQKNLEVQADELTKMVAERTKQLKDTERLVAIGQTAGMVGHDLRNPLQTLLGELYLAKSEVNSLEAGAVKTNLQESFHLIEEQIAYMDKIVSDLQAFVQPVKIDKKPLDISKLVTTVLDAVAIPSSITVHTESHGFFPQIKADPHLLQRVLINLVTNAVQAMPQGGKLNICMHIDQQGQASVAVEDTGVGIPDQIKSQIFTPLFTTKPRGQGFGLAVCKRVIEAHGGNITFESVEGKGTKFIIQFPAN